MKIFALTAIALLLFNSCTYKKSIEKDLDTGATSVGDGLSCDNITLDVNGEIEARNEFVDGERVTVNFNNMKGLTKVGGKFYFGLSIEIKSKSGKIVEQNDDLFADSKGYDIDPITPMAYFNAVFNDEMSKDYIVKIKIWDKKGKGTFNYELPYSIKENQVLSIKSNGLNPVSVGLFDLTHEFRVGKKQLNQADEYDFRIMGLDGFRVENGKVFIAASLKITDANGKVILNGDNLFSDYIDSGSPAEKVSELVSLKFNLGAGKIAAPVSVESVVSDLKTGKSLTVKAKMDLVK